MSTNRFSHLKQKREAPKSVDEFIEGANQEPLEKQAKKPLNKEDLLLSITSRGNMHEYGKPTYIYLKKDILEDISKHCAGSRQAVINYLLRLGLRSLKEKGELVVADHF